MGEAKNIYFTCLKFFKVFLKTTKNGSEKGEEGSGGAGGPVGTSGGRGRQRLRRGAHLRLLQRHFRPRAGRVRTRDHLPRHRRNEGQSRQRRGFSLRRYVGRAGRR